LVLGVVTGWLVGIAGPSFAQNATPAASTNIGPVSLGGDLPGDPQIQLIKVAGGFEDPVNIAFPNDGSGRIFVVQRAGLIRIVEPDGTLRKEPFLDLSHEVTIRGSGEQGLLSLAFHPDYAKNGLFYVDYDSLTANNDVYISEFHVSADDPNRADPISERPLLRLPRPFATHSGGTIRFDAKGYLFIGVGDGGERGDPYDNAQNRFSLLGKMLRIDVNGGGPGRPYGIPPTIRSLDQTARITPSLGRCQATSIHLAVERAGSRLLAMSLLRRGSPALKCRRKFGPSACANHGHLPSIRRRETSTSATWAPKPWKKLTFGRQAPRPARTLAGTGWRDRTAFPNN
jgi:hypothetical protein